MRGRQARRAYQPFDGVQQILLRRFVAREQPWTGDGRVGHRAQPFREILESMPFEGIRPRVVEHEFPVRVELQVPRRGGNQNVAFPQPDVAGRPAPVLAQAAGAFQPAQEGVRDEGIAPVVQRIPVGSGDLGQRAMDARRRHQCPSSRNFSASSAAMQPKPAEVMAWRYTWSATSPAANTPATEVWVALPSRPVLMLR